MPYYCHPSIGNPSYSLPNLSDWRTGSVSKGRHQDLRQGSTSVQLERAWRATP